MIILRRRGASLCRRWQNKSLADFCTGLGAKSVLNIGDVPKGADKQGKRYAEYFPDATFKTLDTRPYEHPDYIQGDLMEQQDHGPYDLVLAMSVIEHIQKPWQAAPNISALVKPGGHLFVVIPWIYPTHEGPDFGDYWRIRPEGIAVLFEDMEVVRSEFFPSVLRVIYDRKLHWKTPNATATGSAILLRKPI